jgi:hypothetical protein
VAERDGASASVSLALTVGGRPVTAADFQPVFLLVGLVPALSVLGFARLKPLDGAEVSGYRPAAR